MQIINEMDLHNVRGDLLGGISATIITLPMAPAFGEDSGVYAETVLLTRPAT